MNVWICDYCGKQTPNCPIELIFDYGAANISKEQIKELLKFKSIPSGVEMNERAETLPLMEEENEF